MTRAGSKPKALGSADRQQLDRRLGLALAAGLPSLEKGWRSTPELRKAMAKEFRRRGWPPPGSIEAGVVPADLLDRLWIVAERSGISTAEAAAEAVELGYLPALRHGIPAPVQPGAVAG